MPTPNPPIGTRSTCRECGVPIQFYATGIWRGEKTCPDHVHFPIDPAEPKTCNDCGKPLKDHHELDVLLCNDCNPPTDSAPLSTVTDMLRQVGEALEINGRCAYETFYGETGKPSNRAECDCGQCQRWTKRQTAIALLATLTERVGRMTVALKPLAQVAERYKAGPIKDVVGASQYYPDDYQLYFTSGNGSVVESGLTLGDCRRAADSIAPKEAHRE